MEFKNKVLIIGYGAVAKCTLPILLKHIKIPYHDITIMDFVDQREHLKQWLEKGITFCQERITPINMAQELGKFVSSGGLIIDLAWNIGCEDILTWCHENKVLYVK